MWFQRMLDLEALLDMKSFFLFGPRATGKSTLIKTQLSDRALIIDMLHARNLLRLAAAPYELEDMIQASGKDRVVIDEVQKAPHILDEVHRLIESRGIVFLLCGSSARRIKRADVNLLAGRAWGAQLFPLTWREMGTSDIDRLLLYGALPSVVNSPYPEEELDAYVHTYLQEEIRAEAAVRNLPAFSRFLTVAALCSGRVLNFTGIGNDCQVPPSTVRNFFDILQDTLLGFLLPAWPHSKKRKAIQTAKFYFFDVGVMNAMCGNAALPRNSDLYGNAFEHWVAMELRAYLSYSRIKEELRYWRSTRGLEVDFLIGDRAAIEVKATSTTSYKHLKGLRALKEEGVHRAFFLVSQDPVERRKDGIWLLPWRSFAAKLWAGEIA